MKILGALILCLILLQSGCSTSSVVPIGQNTYMISHTVKSFVGASEPVKVEAIKQANAFCAKNGKEIVLLKTVQQDMKPFQSDAQAVVYFKAVDKDDPQLKDPPKIEEIWK